MNGLNVFVSLSGLIVSECEWSSVSMRLSVSECECELGPRVLESDRD